MTENIQMGDLINFDDSHRKSKASNTLSTVVGVAALVLILAVLWSTYVRNRDMAGGSEKNTNVTLGGAEEAISSLKVGLAEVRAHERQDAIKLAYTDGVLYGRPPAFAPYHGGYGYGGGCGSHGHHGCGCGMKQKFQEVKTFDVTTDVATLTTTCG
jgi:hypothetical protein